MTILPHRKLGGFHSPIERAVLSVLLAEGCSVVVTMGRSLYRKVPSHLIGAYNERRVLFVSLRGYSRHSFSSSQLRIWLTADLASEIVFAPFYPDSQLSTLHFAFASQSHLLG